MEERRAKRSLGGEATLARYEVSPLEIVRRNGAAAAGYALPFLLVVYLGLKGGGYDAVVRSEIGIATWWVVLLGVLVGVLPAARVPRPAWIALGLLGAFALWTALGISWSESSERSAAELARVASLLGVFALAAMAQGRDSVRRTVVAVGAAIGVIGCLALLSRLHPQWFPTDETAATVTAAETRLNYPLNYWNGLASLLAMGMPLLLVTAVRAKRIALGALACAAIPALSLAAFYTLSRGGAAEIAIAIAIVFALYPRRLELLPAAGVAGLGSAVLIAAATQRDALENSLGTAQAASQGDEMIAVTIVVCAAVGLLQMAVSLAARHGIGPRVEVSRRTALRGSGVVAAVVLVIALAAGAPGTLSDRWQEFKQTPEPLSTDASRFESTGAGARYDLWNAAIDANATEPLVGIGPGTFEFWESRTGATPEFVRDAHSLYLESLAEIGLVGFVLIVGLILFILVTGALRALRGASLERRAWVAAATAAAAAFAAAAAIDWAWELTVLPVTLLLLAAAILGPSAEPRRDDESSPSAALPALGRPIVALVAFLGLVAIAIPLASASALEESRDRFNQGQLAPALERAQRADAIQPYAATPPLQQALVLERDGDLAGAAAAARMATEQEATNWRTWVVLSRIEAKRGRVDESVEAYRRAKQLNPLSPLFQ